MKSLTGRSLIPALLLVFVHQASFANTILASQSGNWNSTSTWVGNAVPLPSDDIIIQGNFTVTVNATATCQALQLGGSAKGQGTGTLAFASGAALTINGQLNVGPVNDNSTTGSLDMVAGGTLTCESIAVGKLGTWNEGTGTVVLTVTNTIPSNNNVNFYNLTINAGATTMSGNVNVGGNFLIKPGASFVTGNNTVFITGDYTNNGTFNGSGGTTTFNGASNQLLTGIGINNFNLLRVDKGVGTTSLLEVTSSSFNAPNGFLNIVNGTFKVSGTFTLSNTFFTGPAYNIDPTAGFWLNNPNVTVLPQRGNLSLRGLLQIDNGNMYVGDSANYGINYVTGSTLMVLGGSLHVAGRYCGNNATQTTHMGMGGGVFSVAEKGSTDAVSGAFDLQVGSSFSFSGGKIVIVKSTSAPADFINFAASKVPAGILQIGDATTPDASVIRINTTRQVGNLLVSNATAAITKPVAKLVGNSLLVTHDINIQSGTVLDANGFNISLGGDWISAGNYFNPNTITFNGSGDQSVTRTAGNEAFNAMVVTKSTGAMTINSGLSVSNSLTANTAVITIQPSVNFLLFGAVSGSAKISSAVTGVVSFVQSGAGQNVLGGNYGSLVFSGFTKALPANDTVFIANQFLPAAGSNNTSDNTTIVFNGASQVIPAFNYFNLVTAGSAIKTSNVTITVSGVLYNAANITYNAADLVLSGSLPSQNFGGLLCSELNMSQPSVFENHASLTSTYDVTGLGTIVQFPQSYLRISNRYTAAGLDAVATGNTVEYNGALQIVKGVGYFHLLLSGAGFYPLNNVTPILGNFTLSGTVDAMANNAMVIKGTMKLNPGTKFRSGINSITIGN